MVIAYIFGIMGNIISFCVFLAPIPTFYKIYYKHTSEGFQPVPYLVALFSCSLLLYYGYIKTHNRLMIIIINAIGFAIETTYIVVFLIYASKQVVKSTTKILVFFNVVLFALIAFISLYEVNGRSNLVNVVGWICAIVSVCGFAAPLSIMRSVIKTKSVEYMSFPLSFFLTLCAIVWFSYGMIRDYYIAAPNVLGFIFGITQLVLYMRYKDKTKQVARVNEPSDEQTALDLSAIASTQEIPVGEDRAADREAGMGLRD